MPPPDYSSHVPIEVALVAREVDVHNQTRWTLFGWGTRISVPLQDVTYSRTGSFQCGSSAIWSLFLAMLDQWNNKRASVNLALS